VEKAPKEREERQRQGEQQGRGGRAPEVQEYHRRRERVSSGFFLFRSKLRE